MLGDSLRAGGLILEEGATEYMSHHSMIEHYAHHPPGSTQLITIAIGSLSH
jgi:hypothetical protein